MNGYSFRESFEDAQTGRVNTDMFTGDQLERYTAGLRDAMNGHNDIGRRRGKTIRPHPPFREAAKEFTPDEIFEIMKEAAQKGDCQRQLLVGLEYAKRGDIENARLWLGKAARYNYPGAAEALKELNSES